MDFKWLHTFVTAAKYENFRKTAETLFISQPTVTVQIKLLEEELGCQLFTRKGRSIHLTKEGRAYLPFALRLLEDYESSRASQNQTRLLTDIELSGFAAYRRYDSPICIKKIHSAASEFGDQSKDRRIS